jgi:hypothetical protein
MRRWALYGSMVQSLCMLALVTSLSGEWLVVTTQVLQLEAMLLGDVQ